MSLPRKILLVILVFIIQTCDNHRYRDFVQRNGMAGKYRRILAGRTWGGGTTSTDQRAQCSNKAQVIGWGGSVRYAYVGYFGHKTDPVLHGFTVYCGENGGGLGLTQSVLGNDVPHEWIHPSGFKLGKLLYFNYNLYEEKIYKIDVYGSTKANLQVNVLDTWAPSGQPKGENVHHSCPHGMKVFGVHALYGEDSNGPTYISLLEPMCTV